MNEELNSIALQDLLPELELRYGWDGRADLVPGSSFPLAPYVQTPPVPPPAPEAFLAQLRQQHLRCDLKEDLAALGGPVGETGPQPSPPTLSRQPPPSSRNLNRRDSGNGSGSGSGTSVGWRVANLSEEAQACRAAVRQPGGDSSAGTWHGYTLTVPYLPGGAPAAAASSLTPSAVLQAETGLWSHQLASGQLPRSCAPGLSRGLWGAWARGDGDSPAVDEEEQAREVATHRSEQMLQRQRLLRQQQSGLTVLQRPAAGTTDTAPTHAGSSSPDVVQEPGMGVAGGGAVQEGQGGGVGGDRESSTPARKGVFGNIWAEQEGEEEEEEAEEKRRADSKQPVPGAASKGADALEDLLPARRDPATAATLPAPCSGVAAAVLPQGAASSRRGGSTDGAPTPHIPGSVPEYPWVRKGSLPDVNAAFEALRPGLAMHFPFELDTFQKEAVLHLEAGNSVFVAAHTSAGKTAVAEYAFALATRHCGRAIYTSPIKTISNQKFRDLGGKFEVGLLTGDVQIRPKAACLIMTTEILRSMLYKGADLIRDVEWVVFDEVHYVNDVDRGVVWEEMFEDQGRHSQSTPLGGRRAVADRPCAAPHINLVLLSATVPNVMEFADWVGRTKRKIIHVTGTLKRPVPLEHSLFYSGQLFKVCAKDVFYPEGVRAAVSAYKSKNAVPETRSQEKAQRPTGRGDGGGGRGLGGGGGAGGRSYGRTGGSADKARQQLMGASRSGGPNNGSSHAKAERTQMQELLTLLTKNAMLPVAIFTFSKKKCDGGADALSSSDLTTSQEKHTIHIFVEKCLARLRPEDRVLPQIQRLRDLMRRGLAVHHAGLLPIMKEVVEMCFCSGYIKVLFCTETFAMGVNAPTRTVVFHSLRKHDGKNFRYLLSGEYTQMAGRAGRRGIDSEGHVIIGCWDDIIDESQLRQVMVGTGVKLSSQFRLTYSMLLNLLRVEDLKVEDMLKRSFAEFHSQRGAPQALQVLNDLAAQLSGLETGPWPSCAHGCSREAVTEYHAVQTAIDMLSNKLQAAIVACKPFQAALQPGRLVHFRNPTNALTELAVILYDATDLPRPPSSLPPLPPPTITPSTTTTAPTVSSGSSSSSSSKAATGPIPGDRYFYLLTLHVGGPTDDPILAFAAAVAAEAEEKRRKAADSNEWAGMKMIGGKGGGGNGGKGGSSSGNALPTPGPLPRLGEEGGMSYLVTGGWSHEIVGVTRDKIKVDSASLLCGDWTSPACRMALTSSLLAMRKARDMAGPGGLQLMDPISDYKILDSTAVSHMLERQVLMMQQAELQPHSCSSLGEQYELVRSVYGLRQHLAKLRHQLSDASLQQMPEFEQRVAVLQELGYLDESRCVAMKGRVLCEVNSTQAELITSEMLFAGTLSELTPAEAVALLSSLVFQEKSDVTPVLSPALSGAREELVSIVRRCARVQREAGMDVGEDDYLAEVMHPGLMEVVHEWALGTPFAEICGLTDVMEGSIVRCVVRLDQACRELADAARIMGNTALYAQMTAASAAIKRDVVFAASLYVA
ncbi:MAG: hypothetical protein WDW38_008119 [Sanguina aurantia]